jgi:ssDNA-binding replication factor A large subunit
MVEKAEEIYHLLLNAGFNEEEIKGQILQKITEFQGLMSKDAILYLIAKEHGINISSHEDEKNGDDIDHGSIDYSDFLIQISEVIQGMQNIVIKGNVSEVFGIRDFVHKDGSPGRVGTFEVCDESSCIKVVLWGDQVKVIENDLFKKGITVQIIGGYSKAGINQQIEIHLSRQGNIVLSKARELKTKAIYSPIRDRKPPKNSIQDLYGKEGFIRLVTGIVHAKEFKEITLKSGDKTFLLKITLTDNTGYIKINIWDIKAVELVNLLTIGEPIKISNVIMKLNSYSNEKELNLTKSSQIKIF